MATMHPIYEDSDEERTDRPQPILPPMRPCSSATQPTLLNRGKFSGRRVSFIEGHSNKFKNRNPDAVGSNLEDTNDDSSVETMTSCSLYSLRNYKPKKEPSFTDYIFCQASFHDIMEEVKGTWADATSAVDQVVHAFVISDDDLQCISDEIRKAEKDIDANVIQPIREIGVIKC